MTYILIGEAPNAATVGLPNLWLRPDLSKLRHAANRLRDIAGWSTTEYLRTFTVRSNAYTTPGGCNRKVGRQRVAEIVGRAFFDHQHEHMQGVVFLGQKAAACAMWIDPKPPEVLTWSEIYIPNFFVGHPDDPGSKYTRAFAVVVPHPSGRNLWYNDPANAAAAREFLRSLST